MKRKKSTTKPTNLAIIQKHTKHTHTRRLVSDALVSSQPAAKKNYHQQFNTRLEAVGGISQQNVDMGHQKPAISLGRGFCSLGSFFCLARCFWRGPWPNWTQGFTSSRCCARSAAAGDLQFPALERGPRPVF